MGRSSAPRAAPVGATALQAPHQMRLVSDARLVTLIREGRRAAFEIAYDRHHVGILSFCRYVLGDLQEAEDAVQHTFLAAYNDLISSDKPIQLRAWLFAIARNRCYTLLRARREQPAAELSEVVTEGLAAQVQRRQDLRDLVLDMRRLPDEQRSALVLAELDALSHAEIGAALGVPREKVKALVFQARESLVASRAARETDCRDIRAELASQRGGALRRGNLRRHLRECPGCRDFRREVERDRRRVLVLVPMLPALKSGIMKGAFGIGVAAVGAGTIAAAGGLGLPWNSSGLPPKHGSAQASAQPGSSSVLTVQGGTFVLARGTGGVSLLPGSSTRTLVRLASRQVVSSPGAGAMGVSSTSTPNAAPSGSVPGSQDASPASAAPEQEGARAPAPRPESAAAGVSPGVAAGASASGGAKASGGSKALGGSKATAGSRAPAWSGAPGGPGGSVRTGHAGGSGPVASPGGGSVNGALGVSGAPPGQAESGARASAAAPGQSGIRSSSDTSGAASGVAHGASDRVAATG
jgi:RNA polymerase sigma factor (sigma-70 family)